MAVAQIPLRQGVGGVGLRSDEGIHYRQPGGQQRMVLPQLLAMDRTGPGPSRNVEHDAAALDRATFDQPVLLGVLRERQHLAELRLEYALLCQAADRIEHRRTIVDYRVDDGDAVVAFA